MASPRKRKMARRKEAPNLPQLVEGFTLTLTAEGKSAKTLSFYEGNLRRFLWYAKLHAFPKNVQELTVQHIRQFLAYVRDAEHRWGLSGNGSESSACKASYATLWHYYVSLRRFFQWAQNERFITKSPMANIKLKRPEQKVIEPYTKEELKALLRVCQHDIDNGSPFLGTRNKAIILLFLDSGVRLSELADIRLDDMDLEAGIVKVTGKGSKQRLVGIAKTTRLALWKYRAWRPDDSPWLWLGEEGQRLTARAIQSMFKRLKDRAGLQDRAGLVHKMRHTMAMSFLESDGDIRSLQVLLGHSDIEMTMRYLRALGAKQALAKHAKASPVERMGLS